MKRIIVCLILTFTICVLPSCIGDEYKLTDGVTYYPPKTESQFVEIIENSITSTTVKTESSDISTTMLNDEMTVYITPKGEKYHYSETCPGKNSMSTTLKEASDSGRTACKRCVK